MWPSPPKLIEGQYAFFHKLNDVICMELRQYLHLIVTIASNELNEHNTIKSIHTILSSMTSVWTRARSALSGIPVI